MNCKILVTGGAGFIGSYLVEKLIENPNNYVVVVDNLVTGNKKRLAKLPKSRVKFMKCDVNNYSDISQVMFSYRFEYVFHLAALVGVQRTQDNPILVMKDINGIDNILQLSKNSGVKRIFFTSSSEVYGEPVELPQNEVTTPLNSRIPYAIVKNVGEAYMKSYQKEYGLEYTIFRYFNTYGPRQGNDFVMSRFVGLALQNKDITIYGDGMQSRTFLYIDDNIEACLSAFYNNQHINDVVNIGSNVETTILNLAKLIIKHTNSKSQIVFCPPLAEGDMRKRLPDNSKMMKLLKNVDIVSLEEGVKNIINKPDFLKY